MDQRFDSKCKRIPAAKLYLKNEEECTHIERTHPRQLEELEFREEEEEDRFLREKTRLQLPPERAGMQNASIVILLIIIILKC